MSHSSDAYEPLRAIIEAHGVQLSPRDFHDHVNEVFHAAEATVYDEVHQDMWQSLPAEVERLAGDLLAARPTPDPGALSVLDIGCGTGLATELLKRSSLGPALGRATLLDPSGEMLQRAAHRAGAWDMEIEIRQGFLEDLEEQPFDVVIACSVLHHIPDLTSFCAEVAARTASGGFFLHLHDPNGDAEIASTLKARRDRLERARAAASIRDRFRLPRIAGKLRSIMPISRQRGYLDEVNVELRRRGVIRSDLTAEEIWRVTDLRVYDGRGVRHADLESRLVGFEPVTHRTYGFFGVLWNQLPADLRQEEMSLAEVGDKDGAFLGALWRRRIG